MEHYVAMKENVNELEVGYQIWESELDMRNTNKLDTRRCPGYSVKLSQRNVAGFFLFG